MLNVKSEQHITKIRCHIPPIKPTGKEVFHRHTGQTELPAFRIQKGYATHTTDK